MAVTFRDWFSCIAVALGLAATACGANTSTSGGGSTISSPAPQSETFTSPPAETSGPEPPRSPVTGKPVVQLAGPSVEGGVATFTVADPTQCGIFFMNHVLSEDVRVEQVSLTPAGAFVRDDSACATDSALCFGYVYRGGRTGTCFVGIRWRPGTQTTRGEAALTLGAICRTRDDVLCAELSEPPPPEGTAVWFRAAWGLQATGGTQGSTTGSPSTTQRPSSTTSLPPTR